MPRNIGKKKEDSPKRPWSAYMIFANEKREGVRQMNPEMKITDVAKELGRQWKDLPQEQKQSYMARSMEEKLRYQEQKMYQDEEVISSSSELEEMEKKKPKSPKHPLSAFMLFAHERRDGMRQANPEMKITQVYKELGKLWQSMPEDQRKPFRDRAAEAKRLYDEELNSYQNEYKERIPGGQTRLHKEKEERFVPEKKKRKKDPKAPKHPLSAFMIFANEQRPLMRKGNPQMKVTDISKELGKMWKGMTTVQKKLYNDKAAEDKQRYSEQMKVFKGEN